MQDQDKTKDQLVDELNEMRRRVAEFEVAEARALAIVKDLTESEKNAGLNPSSVISQYHPTEMVELANVVNIPQIQSLMDDFYKLTNIGIAILDLKGNILVATGWQDICTKYHRVHPDTLRNCIESDLHLTKNVNEGEYLVYKCKNNMWDMVTPIVMGGKRVGNLYLGQFLFEDEVPDIEVFEAQAQRYGFNKDEYLAALNMVPRWSRDKVHTVMAFYSKFASIIGQLSYSNLKLRKMLIDSKMVEEVLRESESRFRSLFENTPVAYQSLDENGSFLDVNHCLLQLLGYTREELIGKSFGGLWSLETRHLFDGRFQQFKEDKFIKDVELLLLKKNGQIVPVILTGKVQLDDQGKFQRTHCIIVDITERKRAEESLKETTGFLNTLMNAIPVPMFYKDTDGRYIGVNKSFEEFFGKTLPELVGKSVFDVYPEELAKVYYAKDNELFQNPGLQVYNTPIQDGRGVVHDIIFHKSTYLDSQGHVLGLIGVILDITDRKRAEKELRESERRLELALEGGALGVWDWEVKTGRAIWDESATRMMGYQQNELDPNIRTWKRAVHPDDWEKVSEVLNGHLSGRLPFYEVEYRMLTKSGKWKWVQVRGKVVEYDKEGKPQRMTGTMLDVTERRKAEEETNRLKAQLFQSQKMESLGTLVGGLAHDFNNMLQIILGYSQLLLEDKKKDDPGYKELQTVIETGKGGADLVKKLLAFGQQAPIFPVNIDLNHKIRELIPLLSRTLPQLVKIDLDLTHGPSTIHADPGQIDQVVMNLAINASEAMPDGGRLKIGTTAVMLDDEYCRVHPGVKPGEYVTLSLSDNGRGMDKKTLTKVFEPFFSTKQRGSTRGTGLGLSVVQGIVEQQGGHITCESEPGKGSEFKIYFPAIQSEPTAEKKTPSPTQSTEIHTILVAEDNLPVLELAQIVLTNAGYSVIIATNGKEALDIYRTQQNQISLVILDLIMPEMSGRDCLMELVKIDPSVKVLIASGFSPSDELHKEINPLVKGFVQKPFGMIQLLDEVGSALRDK